jgi:hypothetical protein
MGRQHQERGTVDEKSTLTEKRSSYIEKDYFKKPQNYCSTGDSRTKYSS